MTISRVGAATGTTSCTIPAHNIGDLLFIYAFHTGANTIPTLGAGFISLASGSGNTDGWQFGYKQATATNDSSGTWTNATALTCVVYTSSLIASGGLIAVGGFATNTGATTTINYPAVTMGHQDGSSWVAGFAASRSTTNGLNTHVPAGMTAISGADLVNTCEVNANDTNGGVSSWSSTNTTVTTGTGWATVTVEILESGPVAGPSNFIQHISSSANSTAVSGATGNNYTFHPPNLTLTNNAVLLYLTYPVGSTLSAITDDSGSNTWSTTPTASRTGNNMIVAAFLQASAAPFQKLKIDFTAQNVPFKYRLTEFTNVTGFDSSTSAGFAGTQTLVPQIMSCGSFTPGHNNCIIVSYIDLDGTAAGQNINSFIKDTGATFNDLDTSWTSAQGFPGASQMFVQGTAAAIRPAMTANPSSALFDHYNCLAVALTTGSQGTPKPSGIHIDRVAIYVNNTVPTPWTIQVPQSGNLGVVGTWSGGPTAATDSGGTTWSVQGLSTNNGFFYNANSSANDLRTLSMTFGGGGSGGTWAAYYMDISGAATSPFDVYQSAAFTSFAGAISLAAQPSITPTTSNGLVIALTTNGIGPTPGLTNSGFTYDFPVWSNEGDGEPLALGNGLAHLYNVNTNAISVTWNSGYATVNATGSSYTSGTGAVVLAVTIPLSPDTTVPWGTLTTGNNIDVTALTGTGSVASLDGTNIAVTASGTSSVSYTGTSGLGSITITGGRITPNGSTSQGAAIAFKAAPTSTNWNGQATFAGAGAFTANATGPLHPATATFAGTGAFTANASVLTIRAVFAGAGAFTANAQLIEAAQDTFAGVGAFTANAGPSIDAAVATFAGAGSLTANAQSIDAAQATFAGAGAFTANGNTQIAGQMAFANFNGAGAFTANAGPSVRAAVSAFAGAGAFTANAGPSIDAAVAAFAGAGLFTPSATLKMLVAGTFAGAGGFAANATTSGLITWTGQAAFTGSGSFLASSNTQGSAITALFPANGRWQVVFDTNSSWFFPPPPLGLSPHPAPNEAGFTLYFISGGVAHPLQPGSTFVLISPSGLIKTVAPPAYYTGYNEEFSFNRGVGAFAAYVTNPGVLSEIGVWQIRLKGAFGQNLSGPGYFTVSS